MAFDFSIELVAKNSNRLLLEPPSLLVSETLEQFKQNSKYMSSIYKTL